MIINGFNTIDGVITASPTQSTNERRGDLTRIVPLVLRIIFLKQKPNLLTNRPLIPSRSRPTTFPPLRAGRVSYGARVQ